MLDILCMQDAGSHGRSEMRRPLCHDGGPPRASQGVALVALTVHHGKHTAKINTQLTMRCNTKPIAW